MRIWQLGMDYFISKARSGCCWTTKTSLEFHWLPGEAVCVCSFQCDSPGMVSFVNKGCVCVCVCVCLFPSVYLPAKGVSEGCAHTINSTDSWSGSTLQTGVLVFEFIFILFYFFVFEFSRAENSLPSLSRLLGEAHWDWLCVS